ncbi:MAG: Ig-like domain-containing protein, partial [Thermoanaerobaculia bacterium]
QLGANSFSGSTGSDHRIHFDDIRQGQVTAVATHPHNGLRGSATSALTAEGEDVPIEVVLQPTGFVRGRALLSDGFTPAVGAAVSLAATGNRYYLQEADENGDFEFEAVVLGLYTLIVQESFGPGTVTRRGNLGANGEIDDYGDLVLDAADPYVVSISPPAGARDLPPGTETEIVIEFSEPIDVVESSGALSLREVGGGGVGFGNPVWSDGDRRLTVMPPLASGTAYEIRVTTGVTDLAGRTMNWLVRSTFTTADVIPPNVVDILPRDGEVQVPVDSVILITFSEPIVAASLSGDGLQLHDLTDGRQLTTTFQLRTNERQVVLTPATPQDVVFPDRQMQVRVKNAVDKAGNVMPGEVVTTFWTPDETFPEISWTVPEEGAVFTSGDAVPVAVTASDNRGMDRVVYTIGDWTFTSSAEPFSHTLLAPVVSVPTDVVMTATAVDIFGNQTPVDRTLHVEPHVNGEPPVVEPGCWADGDYVARGFEIPLAYSITDDEKIESYALVVDGERLEEVTPVDAPAASGTFLWRPPQAAAPGTVFDVRVEARDFAGNVGFFAADMKVPDGVQEVMLLSDQIVNPANYVGKDIYLARGIFTFTGSPQLSGLTLMRGAVVRENFGGPLAPLVGGTVTLQDGSRIEVANADLTATGAVTVRCGAAIDVSAGGYAGGTAPGWVVPSTLDAGGSHGGLGINDVTDGTAGEIYGSVYLPTLGGGSGVPAGSGGGVLTIDAPVLNLEGELRSRGGIQSASGGAGGTVVVRAATLAGGPLGKIDVSGADAMEWHGKGGGGRVALLVEGFAGFDPASQVLALGGGRPDGSAPYAGPGTVFVKTPSSLYGDLYLDAGLAEDGSVRFGPPVSLPALGTGIIVSLADQGLDAVLVGDGAFKPRWLGAWVDLTDSSGAALGTFEVAEITSAGELILAGAGGMATADSYDGVYRFDVLHLSNVELDAADPVRVSELDPRETVRLPEGPSGLELGNVELRSDAAIDGLVHGATIRVHGGATVTPAGGSSLRLRADGTLTVEAGAVLDATGFGYSGGVQSDEDGSAPSWVEPSRRLGVTPPSVAGGSHGGKGSDRGDYPAGGVYGSLYRPGFGGGGGTGDWAAAGGAGGGVIDIEAGELVLEGELRAAGDSRVLPVIDTTQRMP